MNLVLCTVPNKLYTPISCYYFIRLDNFQFVYKDNLFNLMLL